MRKMLAVFGLLFGIAAVSHAGVPVDRDNTNGNYSDSSIYGSSTPVTAGGTITLSTPTAKNGVSGRYCFDYFSVVGTAGNYAQLVDGNSGTATDTNRVRLIALGAGVLNQLVTAHNEPLCFTSGNAAYLVISGTPTVSYAGFISYGGAGGSSVNAGY